MELLMLAALLFFQALSSTAPQPTPIDPQSWVTSDDYPLDALKNDEAGSVEYEVTVDDQGRPGTCRITVSSGHTSLDAPTCNIVLTRGRFRPALGPEGKPITST